MNILLANLTYKPHYGGIENSFFYIGKELQNQGHQVIILCSDKSVNEKRRLLEHEILDGMEVFRFQRPYTNNAVMKTFVDYFDIYRSYRKIKRLNNIYTFDLSILRNAKVGLGVVFGLKKTFNIYIVPGIHQILDEKHREDFRGNKIIGFLKWFYHSKVFLPQTTLYQKLLIHFADSVIVFSNNMKNQLQNLGVNLLSKNFLIHPGVDSNEFKPSENKTALRRQMKLPIKSFVFLIIARIVKVKGIDYALKAFSNLDEHYKRISCIVIVGDGPDTFELKQLALELRIKENIIFFSSTRKPKDFYQTADAFVMSSISEPFGQTILEAMASGLPIVGFRSNNNGVLTATEEIVEDGVNGFLCDFGVDPLSKALAKCINLPTDKYDQIKRRNREKMIAQFTWDNFCCDLLEMSK